MTRRTGAAMQRAVVFKVASALLGYPDDAGLAALPQLAAAIAHLPDSPTRHHLDQFVSRLRANDPTEAAASYVETFDLRQRCCLYLTYYTHGDTRNRGMALLALKDRYRRAGLNLEGSELPDYLPIMLEFAAIAPADGDAALSEHRAGLELLRVALADAHSPYAAVVDAVAGVLPTPTRTDLEELRRLIKNGPPHEEVGLQPFAPPEFLTGEGTPVTLGKRR